MKKRGRPPPAKIKAAPNRAAPYFLFTLWWFACSRADDRRCGISHCRCGNCAGACAPSILRRDSVPAAYASFPSQPLTAAPFSGGTAPPMKHSAMPHIRFLNLHSAVDLPVRQAGGGVSFHIGNRLALPAFLSGKIRRRRLSAGICHTAHLLHEPPSMCEWQCIVSIGLTHLS